MTAPRIEDASSLVTMLRLGPAEAARYADALIGELKQLTENCTVGRASTSAAQAYEQIHSLKNAIAPTGSRALIEACEAMQAAAAQLPRRGDAEKRFRAVAGQAFDLIVGYREALDVTRSRAEASSARPSGL